MTNLNKRIVFLTGTRADYGKIKSILKTIDEMHNFTCYIFITGMHTLNEFGDTKSEIINDNYKNIHIYNNQIIEEPMDLVLANTINGFSRYIRSIKPDLIVVHGDRVEALAAAITGAINNILVAHLEGGEVSGTIDDSLRHSISKLSHVHFVSNKNAKKRLLQLGEDNDSIYIIGSPDIDVILKKSELDINTVKKRYNINFENYAILMYHPVTNELDEISLNAKNLVHALLDSNENYIIINPNNDTGFKKILEEYEVLKSNDRFIMFPSLRFEFFIELLKNAKFLIGNSSAGIHEAPVLGITTINIGSRQKNRFFHDSIVNTGNTKNEILEAINVATKKPTSKITHHFGEGNSTEKFINVIKNKRFWNISKQKRFHDINSIDYTLD